MLSAIHYLISTSCKPVGCASATMEAPKAGASLVKRETPFAEIQKPIFIVSNWKSFHQAPKTFKA